MPPPPLEQPPPTFDERLLAIGRVCQAWCARPPQFEAAVAETVARHGYAAADVERQLLRICAPVTAASLSEVAIRELGTLKRLGDAPAELLHLVSGQIPGLLVESVVWGLVLGSRQQCRPSRDDTTFYHFADLARMLEPALWKLVDIVEHTRWQTSTAARVFGTDQTIDLVRGHLPDRAPVAAHGAREGIAVVCADAVGNAPQWAPLLRRDIEAFRQRGCMSPRTVYVVGASMRPVIEALEAISGRAPTQHVAEPDAAARADRSAQPWRAFADALAHRRRADAQVLVPDDRGNRHEMVDHIELPDAAALERELLARGATLQTAVLVGDDPVVRSVVTSHCSRVCAPGQAHLPPFGRDPDGIGWLRPLLPAPPACLSLGLSPQPRDD